MNKHWQPKSTETWAWSLHYGKRTFIKKAIPEVCNIHTILSKTEEGWETTNQPKTLAPSKYKILQS